MDCKIAYCTDCLQRLVALLFMSYWGTWKPSWWPHPSLTFLHLIFVVACKRLKFQNRVTCEARTAQKKHLKSIISASHHKQHWGSHAVLRKYWRIIPVFNLSHKEYFSVILIELISLTTKWLFSSFQRLRVQYSHIRRTFACCLHSSWFEKQWNEGVLRPMRTRRQGVSSSWGEHYAWSVDPRGKIFTA